MIYSEYTDYLDLIELVYEFTAGQRQGKAIEGAAKVEDIGASTSALKNLDEI